MLAAHRIDAMLMKSNQALAVPAATITKMTGIDRTAAITNLGPKACSQNLPWP